ncbi:uncharacterized protein LOC18030405 [Eutrema salsugineum]|uniref:uncharacterized protein LOC18030405 n=1 Tax=Eutrema salsugineum TaxID=72664 RepID=UPI000CED3149|nr:uncharacterized protein LOC18030405 [Eutrema salsugineum]
MEAANGNLPLSTPLNRLALGNSMQSIIVRLMRLWEAKNYIRNSELMSVDMLLLDEKETFIQASIHHRRLKLFKEMLEEGILFTDITEIRSLPDISLPIKKEKFRLCSYEDFLSLANSNIELPDVVGQVLSIQGANLDDPNSNQKIVLLLLMKENSILELDGRNKVLRNPMLAMVAKFMKTMGIDAKTAQPTIDKNPNATTDMVTWNLKQITQYLSGGDNKGKEVKCIAKIEGISARNGWHYVSCGKCSKKLTRSTTTFVCNSCNNPNAIGIIK